MSTALARDILNIPMLESIQKAFDIIENKPDAFPNFIANYFNQLDLITAPWRWNYAVTNWSIYIQIESGLISPSQRLSVNIGSRTLLSLTIKPTIFRGSVSAPFYIYCDPSSESIMMRNSQCCPTCESSREWIKSRAGCLCGFYMEVALDIYV